MLRGGVRAGALAGAYRLAFGTGALTVRTRQPAHALRAATTAMVGVGLRIGTGVVAHDVGGFCALTLPNELGIAIIEPNVRGSAGYGKSFLKLDNGYKREESVQDIGKLLDWIAKQPELDADRVAVTGGSYGGYMVLASMVHYNDRIRCGIDVVGISNFVTFLQNTEDYRKDLRRVEYGDERDPKMKEFLLSISPANQVDKITKPLFIIQGLNDPRVPASESEQMKNNLQAKEKEVWYLVAKDEGHGFRKKENVVFQQLAEVLFLKKFLLN
jgi:dipeptidyl aminopeptidase/acylaminoacyl peptidase